MSSCYLVRDQTGTPASNIVITANYDGKSLSAISRNDGIARFEADVPDYAVIVQPYNVKVSKVPCLEPAPQPPSPLQPGTDNLGRVGTSCTLTAFYVGGKRFVKVVHDSGIDITQGFDNSRQPYEFGNADPRCHEKPQPTTQQWMDGVTKSLAEFSDGLGRAVDGVRNAVDALGKDFASFKASMYDWLVSRVLDAIWDAMNIDTEKR